MAEKKDTPPEPAPESAAGDSKPAAAPPVRKARSDRKSESAVVEVRGKGASKLEGRPIVLQRRRGFLTRWFGRLVALLLILVLLLLAVFVTVSLVLRSDVPRALAASGASETLGLDLSLAGMDVGWNGDVELRDLVVRLPGLDGQEGEKLAEIPRIKAELGALPRVALDYLRGGEPRVRRVEVHSPVIYVLQNAQGEWNIQRAARLVGGGEPDEPGNGGGGLPPVPEIRVSDGLLVVRKADGSEAQVHGIEFSGARQNPLVYTLAGRAPGMSVSGELFPASGARQQIALIVENLPAELQELFGLPEVALRADWRGGLTGGGVEGLIDITSAQVGDATVRGQLRLSSVGGTTILQPEAQRAGGRPRGLVAENLPGVGAVNVVEGAVIATNQELRLEGLLVQAMSGEVLVREAVVTLADLAVAVDVGFKNLQPNNSSTLTGNLTASAGYDAFGEPEGFLQLTAAGSIAGTQVQNLAVQVHADGQAYRDWRTLDVLVTLQDSPLLIRPPEAPTTLPEAEALVHVRLVDAERPRIELKHLRSNKPDIMELRGWAVYYTADNAEHEHGEYFVSFEQRGLPVGVPRVEGLFPLNFAVELKGRYYIAQDPAQTVIAPVEITRVFGELVDVELEGAGRYVIVAEGEMPQPPLALSVTLTRQATMPSPVVPGVSSVVAARQALNPPIGAQRRAPAEDEDVEQIQPIRGTIMSWLDVVGDPLAMQFGGRGGVLTSNLAIGPFELGTVQSFIEFTLTSEHLTIFTPPDRGQAELEWRHAQLFGAHLDFEAVIPFRDERPGHITLDIQQMQLSRAAAAMALPEVLGTLDGHIDVELMGLSPSLAKARGWLEIQRPGVQHLELAETIVIGRPPVEDQDNPHGGVLLEDGQMNVPVELRQFSATVPGPTQIGEHRTLGFNVNYDISQPRRLQVLNVRAQGYPLVLSPAEPEGLYVDTHLSLSAASLLLSIEEGYPQVRGRVSAEADVWTGGRPFELERLAESRLVAEATRARIEIEEMYADLAEVGQLTGGGTLELEDLPGLSRIWLHGQALDLRAMAEKLRLPEGTEGLLDISVTVQPGPGKHPRGEVLVDLAFSGTDARWRSVKIDQGQVMLYLSRIDLPDGTVPRGQFDFTLATTERIRLQVADGIVDGYFKLRNRGRADGARGSTILNPLAGAGDDWYVNATLDGSNLDLAQIAELFYDQPVEGRVNISTIAYGNLNQQPRFGVVDEQMPLIPLSGEGSMTIANARLRRFDLFNRILDFVNPIPTPRRDWLDTKFRLERGHAYVDSVSAFVDGTEIRMSGRLFDVLDTDVTRIEASGVVFRRPLANIPLPFFREADEFLSIVQTSATAFRARGPLLDPSVEPVLFSEVAETLRVLLLPTLKQR